MPRTTVEPKQQMARGEVMRQDSVDGSIIVQVDGIEFGLTALHEQIGLLEDRLASILCDADPMGTLEAVPSQARSSLGNLLEGKCQSVNEATARIAGLRGRLDI